MKIQQITNDYQEEMVSLILGIQNQEAKINLSIEEQPDLLDVENSYIQSGGNFWVAINDNNHVVGTIAVMKIDNDWCALKKFFVRKDYRSKKIGLLLYRQLYSFAKEAGFSHIILDTPSVAIKSHRFYEKAGFRSVSKNDIPCAYNYPDRNSLIYRLDL